MTNERTVSGGSRPMRVLHSVDKALPVLSVRKIVNLHPVGGQVVVSRLVLLANLKYFTVRVKIFPGK